MECDPGYDVFIGALTWPLLASPRSVTHYAPSFTRMRPYPSLLGIILFLQLFIQHFDRSTLRKVQTRDYSRPMVEEEKEYDGDISEDDKADSGSWLPRGYDVIATYKAMKRHAYVIRIGGKWDLRPVQTVIL